MHTAEIWIASDNTRGRTRTIKTETLDPVAIAKKYGRAEKGELVEVISADGVVADPLERPAAHWDDLYRIYRPRRASNG